MSVEWQRKLTFTTPMIGWRAPAMRHAVSITVSRRERRRGRIFVCHRLAALLLLRQQCPDVNVRVALTSKLNYDVIVRMSPSCVRQREVVSPHNSVFTGPDGYPLPVARLDAIGALPCPCPWYLFLKKLLTAKPLRESQIGWTIFLERHLAPVAFLVVTLAPAVSRTLQYNNV